MDAEAEEGLTVADYVSGEDQPYDDRHAPQIGGPGMQPCGNVGPFGGYTCTNTTGHSGAHEASLAGVRMVWSDVTDESVAKQLAALQRKVRAQANQINKLEDLRRVAVDKQPEYQKLIGQLEAQASLTERENRFRRKAEQLLDHERNRRGELIGNLLMDIRAAVGDPVDSVPPSWATWSELRKQTGRLINMRASERERGDRFQEELRQALAKLNSAESAEVRTERTSRFTSRFYRLAGLLGVATTGETWDTLLQRVSDLKAELEVERVRANARKAELNKLNVRLTDPFDPRMFLGPSAEYGTTPLAARVAELAKDLDSTSRVVAVLNVRLSKLESLGKNCSERYSDTGPGRNIACVLQSGHQGVHTDGAGATW